MNQISFSCEVLYKCRGFTTDLNVTLNKLHNLHTPSDKLYILHRPSTTSWKSKNIFFTSHRMQVSKTTYADTFYDITDIIDQWARMIKNCYLWHSNPGRERNTVQIYWLVYKCIPRLQPSEIKCSIFLTFTLLCNFVANLSDMIIWKCNICTTFTWFLSLNIKWFIKKLSRKYSTYTVAQQLFIHV